MPDQDKILQTKRLFPNMAGSKPLEMIPADMREDISKPKEPDNPDPNAVDLDGTGITKLFNDITNSDIDGTEPEQKIPEILQDCVYADPELLANINVLRSIRVLTTEIQAFLTGITLDSKIEDVKPKVDLILQLAESSGLIIDEDDDEEDEEEDGAGEENQDSIENDDSEEDEGEEVEESTVREDAGVPEAITTGMGGDDDTDQDLASMLAPYHRVLRLSNVPGKKSKKKKKKKKSIAPHQVFGR